MKIVVAIIIITVESKHANLDVLLPCCRCGRFLVGYKRIMFWVTQYYQLRRLIKIMGSLAPAGLHLSYTQHEMLYCSLHRYTMFCYSSTTLVDYSYDTRRETDRWKKVRCHRLKIRCRRIIPEFRFSVYVFYVSLLFPVFFRPFSSMLDCFFSEVFVVFDNFSLSWVSVDYVCALY